MPQQPGGDPAGSGAQDQTILGRYRIEKTLGQGGMGEVLLALDTLLHRRVALKRLLPEGYDHALLRAAILKEARRASRINDPHIAAIYDVLDLDEQVVLVMEFVDGDTLRQRMARPITLADFWNLATQCVEGIAVAHAHGVIHRDIKPENLMLSPHGQVKILDFGIARRTPESAGSTSGDTDARLGGIAGTPQYMAPEAHFGGPVDERTDLFALGAVFYELLAGRHPFEGTTYGAVLERVLNAEPAPILDLNPGAGLGLSRIVTKLLSKNPADRYGSATELLEEMQHVRAGGELATPPRRRTPEMARRPLWVVWTILGFVAIVVASALGTLAWKTLAAQAVPEQRYVAVLAPPVADGDFGAFQLGAIDLLGDLLQRHTDEPGFQLASFAKVLDEKVQSGAEARKILGVNLVLVPTLERKADTFRARIELIDTAHGKPIASRVVELPAAEPFRFLDGIYRASAALLRLKPKHRNDSSGYGIRGAGTLRFYLQGLGRIRSSTTLEDANQAIADMEVACRTEPSSAVARAGLAAAQVDAFLASNDSLWLSRAEATAREAVALDSMRPESHRVLATTLTLMKRHTEALKEYARVVELDPTDDDANLRLARTYGRLGQPERERESYLATIARRPHCWQPYWWLATWQYRQGNVDESIRSYREMIRRAPDYADGYLNLGGVLVLRGDYAAAIDTLRRSLALRPTQGAFENLGTAYFNSRRFQESADAYNQSFQFGTAGYESWVNLGDAYSWLGGRKEDADSAYAQGVRLGRDRIVERSRTGRSIDVMIPAHLAMVFARLGELDSARTYLRTAVEADSVNPMVGYCAAVTTWQLGDRARAIAWLRKAVLGGYPTAWLRDSPIFLDWRALPEFRSLAGIPTFTFVREFRADIDL